MTETLPDPPELDPAALAGTTFGRARRGFEPAEVHAALGRAADALRAWKLRDQHLAARLDDLEERLSDAQRVDETRLTTVLGEETARIVTAARDAAAEIRTNAEEQAARLLQETSDEAHSAAEAMKGEAEALRDEAARVRDEAVAEATRIRSEAEAAAASSDAAARARHDQLIAEAEGVLAERTAEAEQVAATITEAATAQLDSAHHEADRLRSEAAEEALSLREAAREEGRSMVVEAKAVRERILRDLVERRATARRQVEGARAARDRIAELLRTTIDEVSTTIDNIGQVDVAAADAANAAAAGVDVDAEAEMGELLVELGGEPAEAATDGEATPDGAVAAVDVVDVATSEASDDEPTATEESVENEPVAGSEQVEGATDADVEDEHQEADDDDGVDDEGLDHDLDDEDHDSPGATVHDLFARIRAEGLDPEEGSEEDDPAPAADGADGTDEDEVPSEAAASQGSPAPHDEVVGDEVEQIVDARSEHELVAVGAGTVDLMSRSATAVEGAGQVAVLANGEPRSEDAADDHGSEAGPDGDVTPAFTTERELLDRRDELLGPVEKALSRALRRVASDEQNELLDHLRRVKRGRPDFASVFPTGGTESVDRFVDALTADFGRAADAGAAFWSEVSGSSAGSLFGDDDMLVARLRDGVVEFLDLHRAHLERTFADAESEGLEVPELADRVRAAYRDWRSGSLADLAGDLATAGFAHGERRAAGPGTPWRWVVDNGGLPCADGEDNALAGVVACEEPFPTGDLTPPAHPGCRCILAPARQ